MIFISLFWITLWFEQSAEKNLGIMLAKVNVSVEWKFPIFGLESKRNLGSTWASLINRSLALLSSFHLVFGWPLQLSTSVFFQPSVSRKKPSTNCFVPRQSFISFSLSPRSDDCSTIEQYGWSRNSSLNRHGTVQFKVHIRVWRCATLTSMTDWPLCSTRKPI